MKMSGLNSIASLASAASNAAASGGSGSWFNNVVTGVTGFVQNNPGVVTTATNLFNQATGSNIPVATQYPAQYQQTQQKDNTMLYIGGAALLLGVLYFATRKK